MSQFAELWSGAADVPFLVDDEVWAQHKRYRGIVTDIVDVSWNGKETHPHLVVEGWKLTDYNSPDLNRGGLSTIIAPVTTCELIWRPERSAEDGPDGPDGRLIPPEAG